MLALAAVPALAQQAPGEGSDATPGDAPATLDTVTVTGTHIRGIDLETEHPLLVLQREDLLRTGLTGVAEIVQALVVANGQTLNRNVNNSIHAVGTGELRVNLRSLGAHRTLVLVNGQRWASAIDGAVDLSVIPLALVERVEVLKDGASAIYGSDAIGGVVNIITRQKYDGGEIGLSVGQTDHDDGLSRRAEFTFGRDGERWHAAFGLEWSRDDPIMAGARAISALPAPGLPLAATGSPATQYGVFRVPGIGPTVLIPRRPGTAPEDFRAQDRAIDNDYNFAPYNHLQTPQQRRAGFGQFRSDLTPTLALTADALFTRRESIQQLAPPVILFSAILFDPSQAEAFGVSAANVYNPFGRPVMGVQTRWPDSTPRRFEQTVDTAHVHVGLDGLFGALGRDWQWGADATRTHAAQRESASPYADNERLRLAVGPSFFDADGIARCGTPDAVIDGCVPLNLFGGPGRFTQAMLDYVNAGILNRRSARSDALELRVSAPLADLPAGPLGFAAGAERRIERGRDKPDALIVSGRANGTGATYAPTAGAYAVNEAYVEFDVPLLHEQPFARQLDVNLATRWSDYSLFGSTDNARVGLRWRPVDDLLVRSNWAQGFRAPNIFEAFGGEVRGIAGIDFDPCATDGDRAPPPAVAANCLAQGVPADAPPAFAVLGTSGGNRGLRPETSRSLTAGVVYSPAWLPGLDASLDWYRIRIRDAIANPGPQYFLDACHVRNDPVACTQITRWPDGALQAIATLEQNLPGGQETAGWDFALAWRRATAWGDLQLRWDNAYVGYWGEIGRPARGASLPDGSLAQGNVAGTHNDVYGVVWRLRSIATLAWQRGAWGGSISARYFSPIREDCRAVTSVAELVGDPSLRVLCSAPDHVVDGVPAPQNRVGAVTYIDLEASWNAPWKGRVVIGVRNAFGREPPHAWSYSNANSFFPDYDVPGRYWYLSYRQSF